MDVALQSVLSGVPGALRIWLTLVLVSAAALLLLSRVARGHDAPRAAGPPAHRYRRPAPADAHRYAEEVAGAAARELSDEEVLAVLGREAKRRREAAEAFAAAGRDELAAQERAEGEVLAGYLPAQLGDEQVAELVAEAVEEVAGQLGQRPGPRQMGPVMKAATARVAGRAEGSRVAAAVRAALQG